MWLLLVVPSLPVISGRGETDPVLDFPARFVLENLKQSWDASSLQRVLRRVPEDLKIVESLEGKDGSYRVTFSDGSSGDFFPPEQHNSTRELEDAKKFLWADPLEDLPSFAWKDLAVEETERLVANSELCAEQLNQGRANISSAVAAQRAALIRAVHIYGIAMITKAPAEPNVGIRLADALVGAAETTNFGYKFVIKAVEKPHNLAFDSIGLQQHTDFTYCDKVPDIGVFHCINPAPVGGESLWLDGFAAAADLEEYDRSVLAETPVAHLDISDKWDLRAKHPTLEYDGDGNLKRVYFNERTRDSWRQYADTRKAPSPNFYSALRSYEKLVDDQSRMLHTPLAKGDIILFDNRRVLHSRKAFQGERHMEGTYIDWGAAYATYRTLDKLSTLDAVNEQILLTYCGNKLVGGGDHDNQFSGYISEDSSLSHSAEL